MALHVNFGFSPFLDLAFNLPSTSDLLLKGGHPFFLARDATLLRQGQPDVVETKDGFLITAHVPGIAAKDVSVNIEHADRANDSEGALRIRAAGDRIKADYRLPSHLVDVANARASCIDGVLRVVVPKKTPEDISIPVADLHERTVPMDAEGDNVAETLVLEVPGFSSKDINVALKAPTDEVVVTGKSADGRSFTHRFRLPSIFDPSTGAENLTASCINGIFALRIANPAHASAPTAVAVIGDMPALLDAGAREGEGEGALRLVEEALPGVAADDLKIEVGADRKVRVTADKASKHANKRSRCHFSFATKLPVGVDATTVKAYCANGIVRVTANKPVAPATQAVEVSPTTLACLDANRGLMKNEEEKDAAQQ